MGGVLGVFWGCMCSECRDGRLENGLLLHACSRRLAGVLGLWWSAVVVGPFDGGG